MKKKLLVVLTQLAMRLTIAQILIIFSVFSSYATDAKSQEALNKKITIAANNVELRTVLEEIQAIAEVKFIFSPSIINVKRKLSCSLQDKTVAEFLNRFIHPLHIGYKAVGNLIILYDARDEEEVNKISAIDAITKVDKKITDRDITGVILNEKNEPIAGASVVIQGTRIGTTTDADGKFRLSIPGNEKVVLAVSSVGYQDQNLEVDTGTATVTIKMSTNISGMNEVVVVGYGTQRKATLTGSVATVKGADIVKSPAMNVSNSLTGRLPGVIAVNGSGEPGYDGSVIRIRGVNTFGDASPLIVVDGVPGRSLDRIDPATIESISVLKDASGAIYGAQAANGVIMITTKRGKSGKPSINISFNQGYGRATRVPKMADAAEYATLLNEIAAYQGQPAKYTEAEIDLFRSGADPWKYPNTDWFDEVLKPWSGQNYGNASISGGTEAVKYFISLSTRSQDGYYYNSGAKYNQYDFRSNFDGKINKYLSLSVDISGRMEDRNFPTRSEDDIFRMVMRGKPTLPAYWPNGLPGPDIEYGNNPVVISTKATGYDKDKRYVVNSNFSLNLKVPGIDGLSFTANASIDKVFRFTKTFRIPWYLYTWDGTVDANGNPILTKGKRGFENPELSESMSDNSNVLLNALLNYERTFADKHNFRFLAGAEKIKGHGDNFSAYRRNFISSSIDQLFAGAFDQFLANNGSGSSYARLNYFGRVNYGYQNKYLLEFVWRYQGSYIFDKASRYGFFPGVSAGYVVSEESFWNNVPFISYFKLRGSWGATGNDLIEAFRYLSTYGLGGLAFVTNNGDVLNQTLYETGVPNINTTWEKAIQRDIGFDAKFLKNKLSVTADYFYNTRSNILAIRNASVPNSAGITLPPENIGKTSNRGFDFSIDYGNSIGKISYQIGLNGGYAKNKIVFWDETPGVPEYQRSTGRPIGSGLYYEAIGIFRDDADVDKYPHWSGARGGDIIFKDINGDGVIDANDMTRIDKSGTPTWTGGFTFGLQYKSFDLSLLVQGAAGAVQYMTTESGEIGNFLKRFYDDHWTPQNPNAKAPRVFNRTSEYWASQSNTYWLHKTDYIRLKNIELGYSLPDRFKKFGIQNLRIYVNAFNLLTYSPDMKDFDPELSRGSSGAGQSYPLQKIVNMGISLGL